MRRRIFAATILLGLGAGALEAGELTVYTALEADQLKAYKEAFETAMVHQIRRDVELARLKHPAVEVQLLAPSTPLFLRPLDFDAATLGRALDQGRADALACIGRWGAGR